MYGSKRLFGRLGPAFKFFIVAVLGLIIGAGLGFLASQLTGNPAYSRYGPAAGVFLVILTYLAADDPHRGFKNRHHKPLDNHRRKER